MNVYSSGELNVSCAVLSDFATNCYVCVAGATVAGVSVPCWIIDPGPDPQPLLELLGRHELSPQRILLTHGHFDHIAGAAPLKQAFPSALLTCPAGDAKMLTSPLSNLSILAGRLVKAPRPDQLVAPGDSLTLGGLSWHVLDTSGHTAGGVSLYCPEAVVVFTGDSLFHEGIGRTDLPGASSARLCDNIRGHLLNLPENTTVLPGHGPPTTIGHERRHNPFL